jgi:hypothetical protein
VDDRRRNLVGPLTNATHLLFKRAAVSKHSWALAVSPRSQYEDIRSVIPWTLFEPAARAGSNAGLTDRPCLVSAYCTAKIRSS